MANKRKSYYAEADPGICEGGSSFQCESSSSRWTEVLLGIRGAGSFSWLGKGNCAKGTSRAVRSNLAKKACCYVLLFIVFFFG